MTRAATTGARARPAAARRPSALRVGMARGAAETKAFFRERDALVFTFALPIVLLVIFGSIFHGELGNTGVDFRQYFVAGILAAGIMSTSLVNLGVSIAVERDDGTLKRLFGTPMPRSAYFVGKVVVVLVTSLAEAAILLALGAAFYGLDLPSDPGRWLTFGWVFVLGVTASTLLGIVVSSLPGARPLLAARRRGAGARRVVCRRLGVVPHDVSMATPRRALTRDHAWEHGFAWWHGLYAAVFAAACAVVLATRNLPVSHKAGALALMAALVGLFLVVGLPTLRSGDRRRGTLYVVGLVVLFTPAYLLAPQVGTLLFILCPHRFMLAARERTALLAVGALCVTPAVTIMAEQGWQPRAVGATLAGSAVTRRVRSPSASGWPGRSTTRSPRALPASSCCCSPRTPRWMTIR
ncbi:MAG: ABC transporter permease [Streptosporangiaceae bacterium]